jgi:hypothetical protein
VSRNNSVFEVVQLAGSSALSRAVGWWHLGLRIGYRPGARGDSAKRVHHPEQLPNQRRAKSDVMTGEGQPGKC